MLRRYYADIVYFAPHAAIFYALIIDSRYAMPLTATLLPLICADAARALLMMLIIDAADAVYATPDTR